MDVRKSVLVSLVVWLLTPTAGAAAMAGRAVVTNNQRLYREARLRSKAIGRLTIGEEVTVTGRQGDLLEISLPNQKAGWTLANGLIVLDENPHAAALLFEAADSMAESNSLDSWQAAARLFRMAAALATAGPYAAEAAFRAAELAWQAEIRQTGAPSDKGSLADLAAVTRTYAKTPAAARAAFLLLRNSLCEHWDGTPGCPAAEVGLISDYLQQYPNSVHAAEARYAIAYRHAALVEIYLAKDKAYFSPEKAVEHKAKALAASEQLARDPVGILWRVRAERLIWSLQNNVGVYSDIQVALRKQ
ncbi:MAG: SH3 domain-containing protein [Acidobacteria bacterium]|jgi:hypothetical protein|nr:SH3 domain-containing protein [Acidobacteriota bacterium]